ncbi:hypothetical protein LEP3755_52670 [Leptolyngbya sp. NIES-3755]|nr:hypothetical protein LEP3755_52670 [Leptolyngbya sp. NIES-3755]
MDDSIQPILLQEDGVIDLSGKNLGIISDRIVRVNALLNTIKRHLGDKREWLNEGFECEMLAPGGIWQKGRIRLQLEFHPEQPNELFDSCQQIEASQNH